MTSISLFAALFSSFAGVLGFAVLVNAPRRSWIPAGLTGMGAFLIYWGLSRLGLPEPAALFCGTLGGSLAGLFLARRLRMIGTIFLMTSIVSFVPGLGLYRCMEYLGAGAARLGAEEGSRAMISIAMIVLGQGVGSFLFRALHPAGKKRERTSIDEPQSVAAPKESRGRTESPLVGAKHRKH